MHALNLLPNHYMPNKRLIKSIQFIKFKALKKESA